MTAVTIDTLKFANRLKEAGMPSAQAEAQARAIAEALDISRESLATQFDLRALEARLDTRFAKVEGDLNLLKWMVGVIVAGIIALLMKAFLHV